MRVKSLMPLAMVFISILPISTNADVGQVFGNTIVLKTEFCAYGQCSRSSFNYFFSPNGSRAFEEEKFYGKNVGVVYSLGDKTCHTYPYSFVSEGKKSTGEMNNCGKLNFENNIITLTNTQKDTLKTPGWGSTTTDSITTIKMRISSKGKCKLVSFTGRHENEAGKNKVKQTGTCKIKKGKHL